MPPPTRQITFEELSRYFHLPVRQAAKHLNICSTILKRVSRSYGMERWPFRKLKSMDEQLEKVKSLIPKTETEKIEQGEEIKRLKSRKESIMKKPKILFHGSRGSKGDDKIKCCTPLYATTINTFYFHLNPQRHIVAKDDLKTSNCGTSSSKDVQMIPKASLSTPLIQPQPCAVYSLHHVTHSTSSNNNNKSLISNKHYEDNGAISTRPMTHSNMESANFRNDLTLMEPHLVLNNFNRFEDIVAASKRQFETSLSAFTSSDSMKWQPIY